MEIKFNVTGKDRKALVMALCEILETTSAYKGAPTFAYEVENFTIDKNGTLIGKVTSEILEALAKRGFENLVEDEFMNENISEKSAITTDREQGETNILTIEIPMDDFTDATLAKLEKLIESKAELIKKAIGETSLTIEKKENRLRFPWFSAIESADEVKAYTKFIEALCKMSKEQKRVTATAKEVQNEKYAFRCFLLRLGFIGAEYKTERKILLSKLTGNSSFKNPNNECQSAERENSNE